MNQMMRYGEMVKIGVPSSVVKSAEQTQRSKTELTGGIDATHGGH